jgi:hypothetical protein
MTKTPGPTYESSDAEPASVQEPDGAEWPVDDARVDAFIERNREEIIRSLEDAERDLEEGRCTPWEDVRAEIDEMLRALEAGE